MWSINFKGKATCIPKEGWIMDVQDYDSFDRNCKAYVPPSHQPITVPL